MTASSIDYPNHNVGERVIVIQVRRMAGPATPFGTGIGVDWLP
jgi:hypothetical protein